MHDCETLVISGTTMNKGYRPCKIQLNRVTKMKWSVFVVNYDSRDSRCTTQDEFRHDVYRTERWRTDIRTWFSESDSTSCQVFQIYTILHKLTWPSKISTSQQIFIAAIVKTNCIFFLLCFLKWTQSISFLLKLFLKDCRN